MRFRFPFVVNPDVIRDKSTSSRELCFVLDGVNFALNAWKSYRERRIFPLKLLYVWLIRIEPTQMQDNGPPKCRIMVYHFAPYWFCVILIPYTCSTWLEATTGAFLTWAGYNRGRIESFIVFIFDLPLSEWRSFTFRMCCSYRLDTNNTFMFYYRSDRCWVGLEWNRGGKKVWGILSWRLFP